MTRGDAFDRDAVVDGRDAALGRVCSSIVIEAVGVRGPNGLARCGRLSDGTVRELCFCCAVCNAATTA